MATKHYGSGAAAGNTLMEGIILPLFHITLLWPMGFLTGKVILKYALLYLLHMFGLLVIKSLRFFANASFCQKHIPS